MTPIPSADGTYPTGRTGVARRWDGEAWVGPRVPAEDAPPLHAPRSLVRMIRRWPFRIALGGVLIGLAVSVLGTTLDRNTVLLLAGGFLAAGGPILALILVVRRRLGINNLDTAAATRAGLLAGAVAMLLAFVIERALGSLFNSPGGRPNEVLLLLAGPIEEGAKLLVPLILLATSAAVVSTPRLGVYVVLVSGGLFGAVEGALYAADLGGQRLRDPVGPLTQALPGLSDAEAADFAEVLITAERAWTELGHPFWTTGAAAIIWLAAHNGTRNLRWIAVGAYLAASTLHSFNDGVLTHPSGALPTLATLAWIALSYALWFRQLVRRLVPPDKLSEVPARWIPLPPLPRKSVSAEGRRHDGV
ncbi:MAG: PrsW family glutamic-type intramembrane protease [Ornithinimicrobium sp.]